MVWSTRNWSGRVSEEYYKEMEKNPPPPEKCPHGKEFHECNDCMIRSDQAYDAARERRLR